MNIALIGPTGVGKGTHAANLRARYALRHITSGDLLRQHLAVRAIDSDTRTLFDGFPRTAYQATFLDELLASTRRGLDAVILLHAPDDVIVERLSGRLVCRDCRTP